MEVELIVRDVSWRALALQKVMARGALTFPAGCTGLGQRARAPKQLSWALPPLLSTILDMVEAGSRASWPQLYS